jgi:hypothetical protein
MPMLRERRALLGPFRTESQGYEQASKSFKILFMENAQENPRL